MSATGLSTKKAAVEAGLRLLVRRRDQLAALQEMAGLGWDGDLHALRLRWSLGERD